MGRKGSGVSLYETGIRIRLSVNGTEVNEVLRINGRVAAPTKANQKYAVRLADEIRRKITEGTFRRSDYFAPDGTTGRTAATVSDALDTWLKTQFGCTSSTLRGYRSAIEAFWKPALGDKPLRALTKSDILTALSEQPEWSGKTRNNKMSVLTPALQLAADDGLIDINPAASIKAFSHQQPPVDPFTAEERDIILGYFARRGPEVVHNYLQFMFWTGLRTSEGLGLHWPQVGLATKTVLVREGLVEGTQTDRTKTGAAREVDLNPLALAALEQQAKWSRVRGTVVFTHPLTGDGWGREQQIWGIWVPALKRLGVRYRRPYNMRHTYATVMIMAGLKPSYVADQLGHSVQVLFGRYAKWLRGEDNAREQAKLGEYLETTRPEAHGHSSRTGTAGHMA